MTKILEKVLLHSWGCNKSGAIRCFKNKENLSITWLIKGRPEDGFYWDYKDRDGHDNQKHNLRLATRNQNAQNKRIQVNNTSGLKGVTFVKKTQKWMVRIQTNKERKLVGFYSSKEEQDWPIMKKLGSYTTNLLS